MLRPFPCWHPHGRAANSAYPDRLAAGALFATGPGQDWRETESRASAPMSESTSAFGSCSREGTRPPGWSPVTGDTAPAPGITAPSPPSGNTGPVTNSMSGTATGIVVQAGSVGGGLHVHAPAAFAIPQPRQFPPGPGRLCDRRAEMAALTRVLGRPGRGRPKLAVISGAAGIGKSSLALWWLHRHGPFAGGRLYADFGPARVESVQDVLGRWLRALGVPPDWIPADGQERAALWRSLAADRELAILIDNAPSSAAIGLLLPGEGPAVVIATSRQQLHAAAASGAEFVHLGPLPEQAAVALLGQIAGKKRVAAEPGPAAELARLCGGHPLALCGAAGHLAVSPGRPIARAVAVLSAGQHRLGAAAGGEISLKAEFDMSYETLTAPAARAYRLLSLCPGPDFGPGLAAAALGTSPAEALVLLSELTSACVLEAGGDRFHFHDLIRAHARELAEREDPEPDGPAAEERIVSWYLHHTAAASWLLQPYRQGFRSDAIVPPAGTTAEFADAQQALAWLEAERPGLRAAVLLAAGRELHAAAWQLADALWPLWLYHGHSDERLQVSLAGLESARACGDRVAQARMLDQIGAALNAAGMPEAAAVRINQARALWRELGDDRKATVATRRLGRAAQEHGDTGTAITLYRKALADFRAMGDARQVALAGIDLGQALTATGDPDEAAVLLREAAEILGDGNDPYNLARACAGLARALPSEPAEATVLLEGALSVMQDRGVVPAQAEILESLAEIAVRVRAPARARDLYQRARSLLPAAHARAGTIQAILDGLPGTAETG